MRDFNNKGRLHIEGDFNINDASNNDYKLLINCTNDELLHEKIFRNENLKNEFKEKIRSFLPIYVLFTVLVLLFALCAFLYGMSDLFTFIFGASSVLTSSLSVYLTFEKNEFEIQETIAIKSIDLILKSRRFKE
ncbi:MAG: hypothetical protein Q8N30_03945 [Methylococcales bacterium]|nr:hypothetical protein [Methylococcales bacterium]